MKVCFIGGGIVSAVNGKSIGGAERQQALIIEGLKSKGIDVVVLEYYLDKPKEINDIYFYPAWGEEHVSFFSKIKNIKDQIEKHNVDTVYARGTQIYIAFLYLFLKVKKIKIKLFWGIAGDHDLTSKYNYLRVDQAPSLYGKLNRGMIFNLSSILSFYFSDTIICQTKEQLERCRSISKRKSAIEISNIYSSNSKAQTNDMKKAVADAIWIGKFSGNKGEDILLKIAKDIPNLKIICLGHVTESFRNTKIFKEIENQKNICLIGRVPNNKVSHYISKVNFVLNTSPSEGLSNAFLEGWDLEKPVISYEVNPNEYLTKGNAGYCANGSYEHLVLKLQEVNKDKEFIENSGKNGKEILIMNHNPQKILSNYIALFKKK